MIVRIAMFNDFTVDAAPMVKSVLEKGLKVLIYNGDKDYICNWEGSQVWVNNLDWTHGKEFKEKEMESVKGGLRKMVKNFSFYRIFEAGHMVPMDQPQIGLDMLNEFIGVSK